MLRFLVWVSEMAVLVICSGKFLKGMLLTVFGFFVCLLVLRIKPWVSGALLLSYIPIPYEFIFTMYNLRLNWKHNPGAWGMVWSGDTSVGSWKITEEFTEHGAQGSATLGPKKNGVIGMGTREIWKGKRECF